MLPTPDMITQQIRIGAAITALFALGWMSVSAQDGALPGGPGGLDDDSMELLFPLGKPWHEVRLPRFDAENRLQWILRSEVVTRNEPGRLDLEGVILAFVDGEGYLTHKIKTAKAVYDAEQNSVKSRARADIEHEKFDMSGDVMEYDTQTQQAKLIGNVEMIIFDAGDDVGPTLPGESSPSEPEAPKGDDDSAGDNSDAETTEEASTTSQNQDTKEPS
ncbi:MAG: LPS export ABC transporter periplasmic protein LptC [Verrucomicrobiota bacterium]